MIKAVIFDWGGVMIDDPGPGIWEKVAEKLEVSVEEFSAVHKLHEEDFQKGLIREKDLWDIESKELEIAAPTEKIWKEVFKYEMKDKDEMFALVKKLGEKGYKTALLSNTEIPAVENMDKEKYSIFDQLVLSCNERTVKPEDMIFEIALKRLDVNASEAIFVDDRKEFITAAKKLGLNGIVFTDFRSFQNELQTLLND